MQAHVTHNIEIDIQVAEASTKRHNVVAQLRRTPTNLTDKQINVDKRRAGADSPSDGQFSHSKTNTIAGFVQTTASFYAFMGVSNVTRSVCTYGCWIINSSL